MKKALIIGPRGLRGAYEAGVVTAITKRLGTSYFDAIYSCSSGAFIASYIVSNQPDHLEKVFRHLLDGHKLINLFNPFRGKEILDLEYLIGIFKGKDNNLDLDALFSSDKKLCFTATNLETGEAEYLYPTREKIFDMLRATATVPLVHKPVTIDGKKYIDGGVSDPIPVEKVLEDGYDEILLVANINYGTWDRYAEWFIKLIQPKIGRSIQKVRENYDSFVEVIKDKRIKVIKPREEIPMNRSWDTNHTRINQTFDIGLRDGEEYLNNLKH